MVPTNRWQFRHPKAGRFIALAMAAALLFARPTGTLAADDLSLTASRTQANASTTQHIAAAQEADPASPSAPGQLLYLPSLQTSGSAPATPPESDPPATPEPSPTPGFVPSDGPTYYVAPDGNDANPGTQDRPWRTIAQAARSARPGDTIYVRAGTYAEKLRPAQSGTAGAPIYFAAYPGEKVVLDGQQVSVGDWSGLVDLSGRSYITVQGFTAQYSDYAGLFASQANHIAFIGNHTFHSHTSGIGIWGGSDILVDGNDVENSNYGMGNEAISVGGATRFEVRNNKVHNPAASQDGTTLKEGIDIKEGSHDGSVHHNEVYDMQKVAIYIDAYNQHTYNVDVYANRVHDVRMGITLASEVGGLLENIRVYNNVIWNSHYAGIRTFAADLSDTHPMKDIYYLNNTIYNSGAGINVANDQITNFVVRNNIISGCDSGLDVVSHPELALDHNLIDGPSRTLGSEAIQGSPQFVAPGSDFRLQPGSPAIDRGSSDAAPSTDALGAARPQGSGFDLGAYEGPAQ